jgi:hypothetical protein
MTKTCGQISIDFLNDPYANEVCTNDTGISTINFNNLYTKIQEYMKQNQRRPTKNESK